MSVTRRSWISIFAALAVLALGAAPGWAERHEGESVVVHLSQSTNDLHAASMALKLGTALQKQGAEGRDHGRLLRSCAGPDT